MVSSAIFDATTSVVASAIREAASWPGQPVRNHGTRASRANARVTSSAAALSHGQPNSE